MRLIKIAAVLLPLVFVSFGFYLKSKQENEPLLLNLIFSSLQNGHYNPSQIDDKFSEKALRNYIENLDPSKRIFLQEDVKKLTNQFKTRIDNEIFTGELSFFETTYQIFNLRIKNLDPIFEKIMLEGFDFNKNENIELNADKSAFPKK